jgi:hypothetical protein
MTTPIRRGMGLIPAPDPQDIKYALRLMLPELSTVVGRKTHHSAFFSVPLDQGSEGTCVGHGWKHWMMAAPTVSRSNKEPSAIQIYREAILLDEWTDNDWGDMQSGTSLNAGAKALRARGLIDSWQHIYEAEEAIDFVAGVDATGKLVSGTPAILGLPWTESMWDTDAEGFLQVSGAIVGYHCVAMTGWNERQGFARGPNSWGRTFGPVDRHGRKTGFWKLSGENLAKLFSMGGYGVTAIERKLAA